MIPSPHHIQSPSSGVVPQVGGVPSSAMSNHVVTANHIGISSPVGPPPSQSQTGIGGGGGGSGGGGGGGSNSNALGPNSGNSAAATSGRGPFASALRNLAKQADIKEDEENSVRDRGLNSSSGGNSNNNTAVTVQRSSSANDSRLDGRGSNDDRRNSAVDINKKRTIPSPQPAEKIARLNTQPAAMQPELLARSGFQPYRSDDRLMHPAGAFAALDAYSPFAGLGMPPGKSHIKEFLNF